MSDIVLVTGATGTVGTCVTKSLLEKSATVRILVRDPEKATKIFGTHTNLQVTKGDLADLSSIGGDAINGVTRLFILAPNGPNQAKQEIAIAEKLVAQKGTFKQIVKLSVINANDNASLGDLTRVHGQVEKALEKLVENTDVSLSILRPTFFFTNLLGEAQGIKERGHFYRPGAQDTTNYTFNMVDPRDIGEAAATLLTSDPKKYHNLSFTLSGPQALTPGDWAKTIGDVLGKKVDYIPVDDVGFYQSLGGLPDFTKWLLVKLLQDTRAGLHTLVYGDYEILTGKKYRTMKDFLLENKQTFL